MPHCRATEQTSTIRAKNGRQNANASQNKKSYNATHKPTQLQHILFCPTAPRHYEHCGQRPERVKFISLTL
jgi:hypothetical protein